MIDIEIPASHIDLVDGPYIAALTTLMPDGQPQTTPVWCNREGQYILINSMRDFRKTKNMRVHPKVTLLIYDPQRPLHHIEIRGEVVEMREEGAEIHLNELTRLYSGKADAQFFGDSVALELRETQFPVRIKVAPHRVRIEG